MSEGLTIESGWLWLAFAAAVLHPIFVSLIGTLHRQRRFDLRKSQAIEVRPDSLCAFRSTTSRDAWTISSVSSRKQGRNSFRDSEIGES
jgi:hypothetical protein